MKIAVVAVGYNRVFSMERLFASLNNAVYFDDKVDLIISLDKSNIEQKMIDMANKVDWQHGEKIIRTFPERQGLRPHILQCGDLTNEYDAVIVLEDDLVVSKGYYSYVKQCIERYGDDERIAGISLYMHQTVPGVFRPFIPANDGSDVFLMQFAQSWGQCWTRKMWRGFREWYDEQEGKLQSDGIIPEYVAKWDDKSWLKYYIKYTAEKKFYHVYPYVSLTTCVSEVGEHTEDINSRFQVPLIQKEIKYRFPDFGDEIKYDVFFERILDTCACDLKGKITMDLYGMRTKWEGADYLISTAIRPFECIKKYGLNYRPHEENVLSESDGTDIFVYDLNSPCTPKTKLSVSNLTDYDIRSIDWRRTLNHGLLGLKRGIKRKLIKK